MHHRKAKLCFNFVCSDIVRVVCLKRCLSNCDDLVIRFELCLHSHFRSSNGTAERTTEQRIRLAREQLKSTEDTVLLSMAGDSRSIKWMGGSLVIVSYALLYDIAQFMNPTDGEGA